MVLVRRIQKRGANIVVEANAEVLFAPTGEIGRWTSRFSRAIRTATMAEAPVNKRPRWAHYGKPLKATFTASTTYQPGRSRVYSAIGSTSPHAYYVDQGTGIYAGKGPYEAKILPPWHRGSPSLYESTWRPGGPGQRRVKPVLIKGQKGQFFFDRGLKRGFEAMRLRSFTVPGEGTIGDVLNAIPTGMLNFLGNTVSDAAFVAQLQQWRSWRDAAWRGLPGAWGNEGVAGIRHAQHAARKARAKARKKEAKVRATKQHGLPAPAEAAVKKEISKQEMYLATKAAAERRRKAAIEEVRKRNEAKALGEKRKRDKEERDRAALAKRKAVREREKARVDAYKYMHAIEGAYPDAKVLIGSSGSIVVRYTGPDGPVTQYFYRP